MREKNLAGPHARMVTDAMKELPRFISYDLNVASNMAFKPEKEGSSSNDFKYFHCPSSSSLN